MKMGEKIMLAVMIAWFSCGLIASGVFLGVRKRVEFKRDDVITAMLSFTILGPIALLGTLTIDDETLAESKDPSVNEVKRLRKELEAARKAQ